MNVEEFLRSMQVNVEEVFGNWGARMSLKRAIYAVDTMLYLNTRRCEEETEFIKAHWDKAILSGKTREFARSLMPGEQLIDAIRQEEEDLRAVIVELKRLTLETPGGEEGTGVLLSEEQTRWFKETIIRIFEGTLENLEEILENLPEE